MSGRKCMTCDGPLSGPRPVNGSGHTYTVKITVNSENGHRHGRLILCPRCVHSILNGAENLPAAAAVAVVSELKALMR